MWNAIRRFPGTVAIVAAVIIGVVVTSIIFPERSQLIATLGVLAVLPIVGFRFHPVAGWVITGLVLVGVGGWTPGIIREWNRANDPNGTFASFFAKAKAQTVHASTTYQPGAASQASLLAGVMTADAKLSQNFDNFIVRAGSTITTDQLTLDTTQVDSLMYAAGKIKENQQTFSKILVAGGVLQHVPGSGSNATDTVQVDVASKDPVAITIPAGYDAQLAVKYAKYNCGNGYYSASGAGPAPSQCKVSYADAFIAPDLSTWATLYRVNGGAWHVLQDGVITLVRGDLDDETEVEFVINDRTTTFDRITPNVGDCIIGVTHVATTYAAL